MKLLALIGIAFLMIPVVHALYTCADENSELFCMPFATKDVDCNKIVPYTDDICTPGCCYDPFAKECSEKVKLSCKGVFRESCDGFPSCREYCCCTNTGFEMVPREKCDGLYVATTSEKACSNICSSYEYINGCSPNVPNYCVDGRCHEDCTGGDHIVGNENDCGCPWGETCLSSGKCVNITKKKVKEKQILCSQTSHNEKGLCICNDGYYDDYCHDNQDIDFDNDGCVNYNPCKKNKFFSPYMVFGIILMIIFIIVHHFRKKDEIQHY